MKKAAVVIGVDKTGKLTPLGSAAAGAERMADWLKSEGFDVACITDKAGAVLSADVESAVEKFVTAPPRYHLLVVYFSGHGYWQARSDVWLLSGAPVKPNEAINLEAAMGMARYSGIPNVVFISDACRSIPNSRGGAKVEGSGMFPNYDDIVDPSKIDYFKATSESLPAYEGPIGGATQSLLTTALMSAFDEPDSHMVRELVEGQQTIHVVPNRRLEGYLQRKVDSLLASIDPTLTQRIEVSVPSDDDIYLGKVRRKPGSQPAAPPPAVFGLAPETPDLPSPPTRRRSPGPSKPAPASAPQSTRAGGRSDAARETAKPPSTAATERAIRSRLPDPRIDHFETEMGISVNGASVARVVAAPEASDRAAEVLQPGDGKSKGGIVRVHAKRPLSIALQFGDGRCLVLAGLPGYIAHVSVNKEGVSNVSYVPSSNGWRWTFYQQRREELDRLRAMVALEVDKNTFRVQSGEEANALATRIRTDKGVDPTLGLYAANAFYQAGNDSELVSVLRHMRDDIQADLFDVRLLAQRSRLYSTLNTPPTLPVVPFCPMLTQTWHLLNARGTELNDVLKGARGYLCGSLWTTFKRDAADAIFNAVTTGALK